MNLLIRVDGLLVNGNRLDNRIENLKIMTNSEHSREHYYIRNELNNY